MSTRSARHSPYDDTSRKAAIGKQHPDDLVERQPLEHREQRDGLILGCGLGESFRARAQRGDAGTSHDREPCEAAERRHEQRGHDELANRSSLRDARDEDASVHCACQPPSLPGTMCRLVAGSC